MIDPAPRSATMRFESNGGQLMSAAWMRIEKWLAEHAPASASGLNPPASAAAIAAAEKAMGVTFPDDVRATYLRHDGQAPDSPWIFEGWEWLSLERMVEEWQVWKGLLDGGDFEDTDGDGDGDTVRSDWWNPGWIPLTYSGGGDHHCMDLAPGPQGENGQIIEMLHDDGNRQLLASNFSEWIAAYADRLEAGELEVTEYGILPVEPQD